MDNAKVLEFTNRIWDESIVPTLCDYVRIPNKSPNFDPDWDSHGYMDQAAELMAEWCRKQPIKGMHIEVVRLEGRTPLLFIEIDGNNDDTVLLYGHLDKQPEFDGWSDGLTPWEPVIRDGKLYGRGGADDGYAVFGSLTAIRALQEQGLPHARCVVLIEGCEESGSFDLPYYIDHLEERIGTPSLVVCLDAECGNYEQLWTTTSLRGNLVGTLKAAVLKEGVHSGGASGIVPSSFRVLRLLLDRLEDPDTGECRIPELRGEVPPARLDQARAAAKVLGDTVHQRFPWAGATRPVAKESVELILNNTWRPTLCVTGAAGMPAPGAAGNTLRPWTSLKLSFRLPPTADPVAAAAAVKKVLETDPPLVERFLEEHPDLFERCALEIDARRSFDLLSGEGSNLLRGNLTLDLQPEPTRISLLPAYLETESGTWVGEPRVSSEAVSYRLEEIVPSRVAGAGPAITRPPEGAVTR